MNLFTAVRWQVECQDGQKRDPHARDDEVDGVEQCFPPHGDVEGYIQVRFITTSIEFLVSGKYYFMKVKIISLREKGSPFFQISDQNYLTAGTSKISHSTDM